jgi:hypothetical protein
MTGMKHGSGMWKGVKGRLLLFEIIIIYKIKFNLS